MQMKLNSIFCSIAALAVLVSCDKTVVGTGLPAESCPIAFGGNLQAETMVTRAAVTVGLEEVADSFIVTGYKNSPTGWQDVMNSYRVCYVSNTYGSSVTNSAGWEYVGQGPDQVTKYWDYSATEYRFMGYVPKSATGKIDYSGSISQKKNGVVLTLSGVPRIAISQSGVMTTPDNVTVTERDFPLISRLWHGPAPQNEPVRMEFIKLYSKVCVYLMRAADVNATAISGTTLTKSGEIPLVGTVSVSYSIADTVASISCPDMTPANLTFNDIAAGYMVSPNVPYPLYPQYLLLADPDNQSDYALVCDNQKCYIPAELMKLEPGYCYTYIFKLTSPDNSSGTKSTVRSTNGSMDRYEVELSDVLRSVY